MIRRILRASLVVVSVVTLGGCGRGDRSQGAASAKRPAAEPMNSVAEAYVKLVLALGRHDPGYVDAYYGPAEWKAEADSNERSLPEIRTAATSLIARLSENPPREADELVRLRHQFLRHQLKSLVTRVDMLSGTKLSFDEECKALYDVVAPRVSEEHLETVLRELERSLPGRGPLVRRYEAFERGFMIPREKLDAVLSRAIEACRDRTTRRIDLPAGESFKVEYVTGRPWSAYNWYQGGYGSLIQINTELSLPIDRAIDLACHEGYPGHHAYNALLEERLVRDRKWVEFSVYPLFSPQSLMAEGTASFGVEVAFPGRERLQFEREVLFPLGGLNPDRAEGYDRVQRLIEQLGHATIEAARKYLNGDIGAAAAAAWLERYALMARPDATVRFMDHYRSYVINYTVGKDLVKAHIESKGGTPDHPDRRWEEFKRLLSTPRLPSGLN